ncbi:MAG: hypothetical protein LBG77_07960 [Dysgonamonadaceae bacterium]|jgi:hypothetical protein|nr:hypothetical protein [Dysgonamonadaceae bacterium]
MIAVEKLHKISLRTKIPAIVALIEENNALDFNQALNFLYTSQLFKDLDDEQTKLWHFSNVLLYDLLMREKRGNPIDYPDV